MDIITFAAGIAFVAIIAAFAISKITSKGKPGSGGPRGKDSPPTAEK